MFFTLQRNKSLWNRQETCAHALSWPEVVSNYRVVGDPSFVPALPYMELNPRIQVSILILIIYHSTEYLNSAYNGEFISSLSSLDWQQHSSRGYCILLWYSVSGGCWHKNEPVNVLLLKLPYFGFILKRNIKYDHYDNSEWILILFVKFKTFIFSNYLLGFVCCGFFFLVLNQIVFLRLKHAGYLEAFLFSMRTSVNMIQSFVNADMHSANLISPEINLDAQKWWNSLILPTEDNV